MSDFRWKKNKFPNESSKIDQFISEEYEDTENAIKIYFIKERFAVCSYPLEDRSD